MELFSFAADADQRERELFYELARGGRDAYQVEVPYRAKNERSGWLRRSVSLVRNANGAPEAAIAMM